MMHPDLSPVWEHAEALKADLLARVAAQPGSQQKTPPSPGEWSPLQIVSHLVIAERFVASYGGGDTPMSKRANPFVINLLCAVLGAGIALPTPTIMEPEPNPKPLETLADEWEQVRGDLRAVLETANPDTLYGVHPYFGAITVRQTLQMLDAHTAYHVKRFPKPVR